MQRGCKLYTYLDFRSRFFQILAKYSKFRCVFFMFHKRQKEENPYSTCLKTNFLVLFLYWNFFGSDWINSHFLSPKRNFKWLRFFCTTYFRLHFLSIQASCVLPISIFWKSSFPLCRISNWKNRISGQRNAHIFLLFIAEFASFSTSILHKLCRKWCRL